MKKQELATDIIHYTFPPRAESVWRTNATVLLKGKKALLLDTGYEFQAKTLLEDLAGQNIQVEAVVLTHFHDDHMEGLKLLPGIPVYGSSRFQETLDLWTPQEDHVYYKPTVAVDAPFSLSFGAHTLTLVPHPGHSACGLLILINDQFLHVGDEIIFAADGQNLLPALDGGMDAVKLHLESLHRLRGYEGFAAIIPSHGPVFAGAELAEAALNRCVYLQALLDSKLVISFADATKDCTCSFMQNGWHESNCR